MTKRLLFTFAFASLLSACGTMDPSDEDTTTDTDSSKPMLPLAVGNVWTYQVTDDEGAVTTKTTTIEEESVVGGSGVHKDDTAFHVVTMKKDGTDKTESWQAEDGERVVRYRELSYSASTGELELDEDWDPSKLHVDGSATNTEAGASFLEIYTENKTYTDGTSSSEEARDLWTVVAVDESVTVPAGTFASCIHLQKSGGSSTKDYWYARGVGKVKETGTQTEELASYSLE